MAHINATQLLEQLEALAKQPSLEGFADESTRMRLREAARKVSVALETSGDVVHRIANTVRSSPRAAHDKVPKED